MHMRHDYVNFLAGHTVSSTFNYLYLLPFNGLIAFLSVAIGQQNFLTVTSSLIYLYICVFVCVCTFLDPQAIEMVSRERVVARSV